MATTVPGGAYLNGDQWVNAEGERIEQPAEVEPVEVQPEPVAETEEGEQPAEVEPAKPAKRSKK